MIDELLPSNASPVTRSYARIWGSYWRYEQFLAGVKSIGVGDTPDDWVPWFIWDYGLEDVVPYVRDYRKVLAEGPAWQRLRGTPRGIEIGIGWVESEGIVDAPDGRHNWWQFQVGFPVPPTDIAQIQQLAGIIKLSAAAEDELFRMFSPDYDQRPVRMDENRFDTGGRMDGYSGEVRWEDGPIISFGTDQTIWFDLLPIVSGGSSLEAFSFMEWFDSMRLDVDSFDDSRPISIFTHGTEYDSTQVILPFIDGSYPEEWQNTPWSEFGDIEPLVMNAAQDDSTLEFFMNRDVWDDAYPSLWAGDGSTPIIMEPT